MKKQDREEFIRRFLLDKKKREPHFFCKSMNAEIPVSLCNMRRKYRKRESLYSTQIFTECRNCVNWSYWQQNKQSPEDQQPRSRGYSKRILSNPPYGYLRYSASGDDNIIDVDEMETINIIIRMRDNPKTFYNFAKIARFLASKNRYQRNKKKWTAQSVRAVYCKQANSRK